MAGKPGRSGGKNAKSLSVLKLEGRVDKRFHKAPETALAGSVTKPRRFTKNTPEGRLWASVVPSLEDAGLICAIDQPMLESMCVFYGWYVRLLDEGKFRDSVTAWKVFEKIGCQFGLTPTDRIRFRLEPSAAKKDPVEDYLNLG